jgi:hypothetical protein
MRLAVAAPVGLPALSGCPGKLGGALTTANPAA